LVDLRTGPPQRACAGRNNLPLDHPLYRGVLKRFFMQPDALLALLVGPFSQK